MVELTGNGLRRLKGKRLIDRMRNSRFWRLYVGTAIVASVMLLIGVLAIALRG